MSKASEVPLCLQPTKSPVHPLIARTLSTDGSSLKHRATTNSKRGEISHQRREGARSAATWSGFNDEMDSGHAAHDHIEEIKCATLAMCADEDDGNLWPVLVAVRCRPRKRQRAGSRFLTSSRSEEWKVTTDTRDSSSDSSTSSSDGRDSNRRSLYDRVQRGVFEYTASREYSSATRHQGELPPRRTQRPRRLYVQALTNTPGNISGKRSFDFDFLFPPWKKQRDVYDECVKSQIESVLQSHQQGRQQHATIVAYGQTGTGKTYTMGMLSDFTDDNEQGLIPRALSQVLEYAARANVTGSSLQTVVTLSFLQIYLETIQDLLALPGSGAAGHWNKRYAGSRRHGGSCDDLRVRQDRDGDFHVTGLSEYDVASMEDAYALLNLATRNRVLAATAKNKTSSRSHTLLTISLKQRPQGASPREHSDHFSAHENELDDDHEHALASTISFVDLAGSERVDGALHFLRATRTRQEQRIREAKFINRSLSALGGVIAALAQPKAPRQSGGHSLTRPSSSLQDKLQVSTSQNNEQHIRFRDSQLTKLLQGRLMSGRGRLLLIATVDDQPKNLSETLSTLKFAAQCRRVELNRSSRLRGDRSNRSRAHQSLLDQVFQDMKIMHESREAALHLEYQARIEALERELEAARAGVHPSLSTVQPIHLASYTALCSLVDSICALKDDRSNHPSVDAFQTQADMLQYIAALYSQLKEALLSRKAEQKEDGSTTDQQPPKKSLMTAVLGTCKNYLDTVEAPAVESGKAVSVRDVSETPPTKAKTPLTAEQEVEFRAVARHLMSTHALDAVVVSSADEDQED